MTNEIKNFKLNCIENIGDSIQVSVYDDGEVVLHCFDGFDNESAGVVLNVKEFIELLGGVYNG